MLYVFSFIGLIDESSLLYHLYIILHFFVINNIQRLSLHPFTSTSFYLTSKPQKRLWSQARGQIGKQWKTLGNALNDICYLNFLSPPSTLPTLTCCDCPIAFPYCQNWVDVSSSYKALWSYCQCLPQLITLDILSIHLPKGLYIAQPKSSHKNIQLNKDLSSILD